MLFSSRGTDGRRTWIIMLLYWCQQVTGMQFVLFFGTYFFELIGVSTQTAFSLNVGTLALGVSESGQLCRSRSPTDDIPLLGQVLGNLIGIGFMNRAGRRLVFLTSVFACTLDTLLIGVCSVIPGQGAITTSAIFTMIYLFCFQIGL
jgi:SP family general alpha glucoside:H+ symporter-like MFS transporter